MQKQIRNVDKEKGIMQVTTVDERWYFRPKANATTGLPEFEYFPSSTWISSMYPKSKGFWMWLAEHGWDESEAIKNAAGDRGSKVHAATETLEKQGELSIDTVFKNNRTEMVETLTTEELDCIMSFAKWHEDMNPQVLATEMTVFGDFYAGTLDNIYRINGQIYIVDKKTSKQIWEEMKLQVSSYSHAHIDYVALGITKEEWESRKLAILQLGYPLNKNKYKFTEIEDKYDLFKIAYQIWLNENPNSKPKQKDYPLIIKIKKEAKDGLKSTEKLG